ncbi:hypothetical protein KFU94_35155 [Chloroflexi bacterium TSY]|nr:hypothetical protein [Chloroflexi bacterium TSY]
MAFEALYEETLAHGMGSKVTYALPYPKHEFLRYLVDYKGLLMHGTDIPDIDVLRPLRDSIDSSAHGNVSGVYADKGYMRPIYFAVVHRGRSFGLTNGVFDLNEDGLINEDENDLSLDLRYYKLAIGLMGLRRNPWRNGTVYALPPDTFELWNEWTSRTPVKPVLSLDVTPDDLPLKDDVWGIDYRMISEGIWGDPFKDEFPFLKDARTVPFHLAGRPPWLQWGELY